MRPWLLVTVIWYWVFFMWEHDGLFIEYRLSERKFQTKCMRRWETKTRASWKDCLSSRWSGDKKLVSQYVSGWWVAGGISEKIWKNSLGEGDQRIEKGFRGNELNCRWKMSTQGYNYLSSIDRGHTRGVTSKYRGNPSDFPSNGSYSNVCIYYESMIKIQQIWNDDPRELERRLSRCRTTKPNRRLDKKL